MKRVAVSVAFVLTVAFAGTSFAQNSAQNNQPVVGTVHERESSIQKKMQQYYKGGLIDSAELARFQRDFDGICVKEDRDRMTAPGLTNDAKSATLKKLDMFEKDLDTHANKSGTPTRPPAEPK